MTQASDDFMKALAGLKQAASTGLEGAAQQTAAELIDDLARLAGIDGGYASAGASSASFGAGLAEVRRLIGRELSGNAFYAASIKLDSLAGLPLNAAPAGVQETATEAAPADAQDIASEAAPHVEPAPAVPADASIEDVPQGPSFDELNAAAKARVDEVAASLGIVTFHQHHDAPHLPQQVEEAPVAAAELERRSSEPCAMPEVLPIEPVAQAVSVEPASVREVVEAAHDIGAPALAALPEALAAVEAAPAAPEPAPATAIEVDAAPEPAAAIAPEPEPAPAPAAEIQPAPKPEPEVATAAAVEIRPAPAPEPAAAPKPETVRPKPEAAAPAAKRAEPLKKESKPKDETKQKTFFGLWLDTIFGRKK
jgi:hypothetical protein